MDIQVSDVYSRIADPSQHAKAVAVVGDVCKARPRGYQYSKKYRSGMWDGYIKLGKFGKFPTGLLADVRKALEDRGFGYNIVGGQCNGADIVPVMATPDMLSGITLRDYQIMAANELLSAGRGIAKIATGGGKTEIMAAIIKALGIPKTIVLVHMQDLLYQTVQRLQDRLGCHIGMIGDSKWDPDTVTVSMVQTLSRKLVGLDVSDNVLLLADECHHASNDTTQEVLFKIPGRYRFGFSGTPIKYDLLDDIRLIGATGPVVVDITSAKLIEMGYLAKPIITMHKILGSKKHWEDKYPDAYKQFIIANDERNQVIADYAKTFKGTTLILVNNLAHGDELSRIIKGSVWVQGSDTAEYRQMALAAMRDDEGIFIASPIFDEGVDVPSVGCLILAAGGLSNIKLLQRLGRGLRSKEGRNELLVCDFIDKTNKHLYNHSLARMETYDNEGFEYTIQTATGSRV